MPEGLPLLMDRAYEGDETRQLALDLGLAPVMPPKTNRVAPWSYNRALYAKRNEIKRLFRKLKATAASSPALKSSMPSSSASSPSPSSSKRLGSVNTP